MAIRLLDATMWQFLGLAAWLRIYERIGVTGNVTSDYLLFLALVFPLAGMAIVAACRRPLGVLTDKLIVLGPLAASAISLVLIATQPLHIAQVPYWGASFDLSQALRFSVDGQSLVFSLLLLGGLALGFLQEEAEDAAHRAVTVLFAGGVGLSIVTATGIFPLCVTWVVYDVGTFGLEVRHASRSQVARSTRVLFTRLLSDVLVIAATWLLIPEHGDLPLSLMLLRGMPHSFLLAAAILRMSTYPLPGSLEGFWLWKHADIVTGAYLWVRITDMPIAQSAGSSWILTIGFISLILSALHTSVRSDSPRVAFSLAAHWGVLLALAPLVDATGGRPIALACALNLALGVVPWLARRDDLGASSIGELAALGSAGGLPFTVGFVARWAFLNTLWHQGQVVLFALAALAFALASWPVVLRIGEAIRAWRQPPEEARPRSYFGTGAAVLSVGVGSLILAAAGIIPTTLSGALTHVVGSVPLPSPVALVSQGGASGWVSGAAALLACMSGLVIRSGPRALMASLGAQPQVMHTTLDLDWFYASLEHLGLVGQSLLGRCVSLLEGWFALGWMVLWLVVIVLYLMGV